MSSWINRRRSAVLLHISSLPGPFHSGVLGKEAHNFIDDISVAGFSVWQFLPIGPTHGHGSPYESLSSYAGNPSFIDLREFVELGLLNSESLNSVNSEQAHENLRRLAAKCFWQRAEHDQRLVDEVSAFSQSHDWWLSDYALFCTLKSIFHDQPWWAWPEPLRDRHPAALSQVRSDHEQSIQQCIFEQMMFDKQWQRLQRHAETRDVLLFGDLPIYVSHDSADVWTRRDLFTINELGLCDEVAGVPPDYFSETGQRWGNPLYRWDVIEAEGFDWWVQRLKGQFARMHLLRIDHFRGLEAYWAIPGESQDGILGEWRKAPGVALLETLNNQLGRLPLIAEDLGVITPEVNALREKFKLPGMKILQFAFNGDPNNPYLPEHHVPNSVVYTGTHDNDTTMGWFSTVSVDVRKRVLQILGAESSDMPWALIKTALDSPAKLAVIPMQDLLELGTHARMNLPGTVEGNWAWRMRATPDELQHALWKAGELNQLCQRTLPNDKIRSAL